MEVAETTAASTTTGSQHAGPPRHSFDRAAAAVIAVFVIACAYLIVPGGFYIDDFRAQAYAAGRGPWPFIIESNATHLAPGARTMDWLQAHYWPLEHFPAVVFTLTVCALLGVAVWRLLNQLVTRRSAALLGLGVALFAPSIIPAVAWYRQALTTMTALVFILLAVDAGIRYLRGGPRWYAYGAWLSHAVGLAFSERTLVVPVVLGTAGLLLVRGTTFRHAVGRLAVCLGPMVLLNLGFLAFYGSGDYDHAGVGTPSAAGFAAAVGRSLFRNTIPSMVGGPLAWRGGGESYSYAQTPLWLAVVGCAVLALLALAALRRRSRAGAIPSWRPLLVVLSYVLPIYLMIYVGRIARTDIASVDDLRLFPDVGVFLAIGVAVLLDKVLVRPSPRAIRVLVTCGVAAAVGCSISWVGFAHRWHQNSSSSYVEALRSDLTKNLSPVVPTPVPANIVPNWVQPDFSTADLIAVLHPATRTVVFDSAARLVGPSGRLEAGRLNRIAAAPEGRSDFCRHPLPVGEKSVTIQFDDAVPYYRGELLEVGLLVSDTTSVALQVTAEDGSVSSPRPAVTPQMQRGPHRLLLPVAPDTRVKTVVFSRSRPGAALCITNLQVVQPPEPR